VLLMARSECWKTIKVTWVTFSISVTVYNQILIQVS
jgi:hypothetical protein